MINLNTPVPVPPDSTASFDTLAGLVRLLADPKATTARAAELRTATQEHRESVLACNRERAALLQEAEQHRSRQEREAAAHRDTLAAERRRHDDELSSTRRATEEAHAQAQGHRATAAAEAEAAAVVRAELEKRLHVVRVAAQSIAAAG
jgi:hypothetical protein